jgi:uncharacterized protein YdaU (DUF1376 family)
MFHYQKNIGDYRSATMHFSLLEHGIYNQLLDWYYLDESPIPSDNRTLFRRLSAKSDEEQKAVLEVLNEMFEKSDLGWSHKRVEREITQYKAKAEQAREAGKLGGRPSKKGVGFNGNRDGFEKKPDAKPTINQEPLTKNHKPNKKAAPLDGGRFDDFWKAWPANDRKQDRRKCAEKWAAENLDGQADAILEDIEAKKLTEKWQGGYVEAPLVYLNNERWLDGGGVGEARTWWDSQSGIRGQGDKLRVPYAGHMASGNAWLRYVAAVWLASGDGPWWESNPNVKPIALALKPIKETV